MSVPWHGAIISRPAYLPVWSLENSRAAARRIRDDWPRGRRRVRMRSPSTSLNHVCNLRINMCGDDWEGPVDQYFLLKNSVASVINFSFLSVTSVSSYL